MADARPTIKDLSELILPPGPNNDLIDLTAKQPRLAELDATVFPRAIRTLDRASVVEYARGYTPDLVGWITKFAEAAGYYDANGHYARVMPVFSLTNFDLASYTLTGVDPTQRLHGFQTGQKNRCPGGSARGRARRQLAVRLHGL